MPKSRSQASTLGYLSAFLYCFITAISVSFIHYSNQMNDPTSVLVYAFFICTVFYNLLNLFQLKKIYLQAFKYLRYTLLINFTTLLTWLTTFWSLKFISATIWVSIFMGFIPITSLILSMTANKIIDKYDVLKVILIASLIIIIVGLDKHLLTQPFLTNTKGILLAIISGSSLSIYMKFSKILHEKSLLTPSHILCIRFYFLIIIGFTILLTLSPHAFKVNIPIILMIACLSCILPLYFLQTSIYHIGPINTAYIMPFTPIFTYFIQFIAEWQFNLLQFCFIFLLCLVLSRIVSKSTRLR